jgi:hypothetical protein
MHTCGVLEDALSDPQIGLPGETNSETKIESLSQNKICLHQEMLN